MSEYNINMLISDGMSDQPTAISPFDSWYNELCVYLNKNGKRAPYKMAWIELYEQGLSIYEAANIGTDIVIR
ncbi:hypothetical protein U4O39_19010 [Klebsiella pneumoniae]|nr:hypothetical protein [Klebsiella pneumoniae]